jgi:hypothetical protein
MPILVDALRDGDPQVVREAIGALQQLGGVDAQRALFDLMRRAPPRVASEAAVALEEMGGETARTNAALIAQYRIPADDGEGDDEGGDDGP